MADLSDDIAQQAVEPITSAADGQSSTGRSVGEMIQADQYLGSKAAAKKRRRGVVFTKLEAPGALPDCGGLGQTPFDRLGGI